MQMNFKGYNGQILVDDEKIVIVRKGAIAKMSFGLSGEKTIPIASIQSVQFKAASALTNGFIQFGILGGNESRGGLVAATRDENTVTFTKAGNSEAMQLKEYLEKRSMELRQAPAGTTIQQATSEADELAKFKQLLDQGIISQDEFDAKKRRILGL